MSKKVGGLALIVVLTLVMIILPNVAAQDDAPPAAQGRPLLGVAYTTNEDGFPQIARVDEDTPAAEAGLMVDDVITAIDGDSVEGEDLAQIIGAYGPGDTITVTIMRSDEGVEFEVTLAEYVPVRPDRPGVRMQVLANTFLGISVEAGEDGLTVLDVVEDSPAAEAGLQAGDIVIAFNGEDVTDVAGLREAMRALNPGDTVTITVLRDDEQVDLEATLAESAQARAGNPDVRVQVLANTFLGISVEAGEDGITIVDVVEDSPAAEAGLQAGDVVVTFNGEDVTDVAGLRESIQALSRGDTITLGVLRDGESMEIEATLGSTPMQAREGILRGDFGTSLRSDNDIQYLPDEGVWEVNALDEGSALAEAGLQVGDRITEVNGQSVELDFDESRGLMHAFALGGEATLTVERDGETLEVEVPAAALMELMMGAMRGVMPLRDMMQGIMPFRPFGESLQIAPRGELRVAPQEVRPPERPRNRPVWLGVRYLMLDEQSAETRDLPVSEGALLLEIEPLSPAEVAGLQVGDIITAVDGDVINARRVLARQLNAYSPGDMVTLDVLRAAESMQVEVTLEPVPQSG